MANEKWNCNQICRWNDPSDGCIKPTYATCPMANTEPDASGWGQVNEKRLIDANSLKRFTCETCNAIYGDEPCEPCDCRCMAVIDEQPTVDAVEVVHGRWEIVTGSNGKEYMVCTECRKQQTLTGVFSYCPNCGAKMDGGNEDV